MIKGKKRPSKEEIIKEIRKIKAKTKDHFAKLLISHLEDSLNKANKVSFGEVMEFDRIKNLFDKENKRNVIKNSLKIPKKVQRYIFKITLSKGIWSILELKGSTLLSKFSSIIQSTFGHEPGHLYEFELSKYKFGPECDEWQETSDSLDNIRLDSALNSIGFKVGDSGTFKYDFGEDIEHALKLVEIKDLEKDVRYPNIEGNNESSKCENCKSQNAVFYCHACEMKLCDACSEEGLRKSNSCSEGHYPLLTIFQNSKSYRD